MALLERLDLLLLLMTLLLSGILGLVNRRSSQQQLAARRPPDVSFFCRGSTSRTSLVLEVVTVMLVRVGLAPVARCQRSMAGPKRISVAAAPKHYRQMEALAGRVSK